MSVRRIRNLTKTILVQKRATTCWAVAKSLGGAPRMTMSFSTTFVEDPATPVNTIPLARPTGASFTKEQALDSWRVRSKIVDAGMDTGKLLAILGEHMHKLDPSNTAIAIQRLSQAAAATAQASPDGTPSITETIAGDHRFRRFVQHIHEQDRLVGLSAVQLSTVVQGLACFGVKLDLLKSATGVATK